MRYLLKYFIIFFVFLTVSNKLKQLRIYIYIYINISYLHNDCENQLSHFCRRRMSVTSRVIKLELLSLFFKSVNNKKIYT